MKGRACQTPGHTTKWLGKAIRGLRSFAYGTGGERPKVGLALGGGFARGVAHVGVLRVLEEHEIPIDFIAGHFGGRVDCGGLCQRSDARSHGATGCDHAVSRFRALDAFADGHGFERTAAGFSAPPDAGEIFSRDAHSAGDCGDGSVEGHFDSFHRGRNWAGAAGFVRVSGLIFAGGTSGALSGGWISDRAGARRRPCARWARRW